MTPKGLLGMYRGWWGRAGVIGTLAACVASLEGVVLVLLTQVVVTLLGAVPGDEAGVAWQAWLPETMGGQLAWGVGAAGLRAVIQAFVGYLRADTVVQYRVGLRRRLYDAWFAADWNTQSETGHAELDNLLTPATKACTRAMQGMLRGLESTIAAAMLMAGAFLMAPQLSGVLLAVGVGLFLIQRPLVRASQRVGGKTARALRGYGGRLAQAVARAEEVRAFGVESAVFEWVDERDLRLTRYRWWSTALREMTPVLFFNLAVLAMVGAVGMWVWMDSAVVASAPALVVCFRAVRHGQNLARVSQSIREGVGWHGVFEDRVRLYQEHPVEEGDQVLRPFEEVVLEDVGFAYPDGTQALSSVSARLKKGSIVGLVGPSGAGKSTLVELLLRLRVPTHGRVRFGDQDLQTLTSASLYRRLRYVPQAPEIKEGSVKENLEFYRGDLGADALRKAWAAVGLEGVLPGDLEARVGTGGATLSGGQRQRLVLARALIGEADLWILDEPTSALDSESEGVVHRQIRALASAGCVLVVAHRPATLTLCDRLWVMEEGQVLDAGPREEVLLRHPHFAHAEA